MAERVRRVGEQGKKRRMLYWALTLVFSALILEAGLSVVYFHVHSPYPLASLYAARLAAFYLPSLVDETPVRRNVGIWQTDTRFGYSHKPSSRGIHRSVHFEVEYTIGSNQERVIQASRGAAGRILMLGGSYTFGHGVNDDETFPYVLATEHWTNWTVQNRAVSGWGTSHAYMVLLDELASQSPPSAVIYTMVPHHIVRNYIGRNWVRNLRTYGRLHPHFEIVDGELSYRGVVGLRKSRAWSREVRERELQLTSLFLTAMNDMCDEAGIPFSVVLLLEGWPVSVIETLIESGIAFVDLSELPIEGLRGDEHPNAKDYRRIAERIAASSIGSVIRELEEKRAPGTSGRRARHGALSGAP